MKRLVVGLLAHVDSGKTTLAEGLLYRAGVLRKLGRVDHRDAFLDTDSQEQITAGNGQISSIRAVHANHPQVPFIVIGNTALAHQRRYDRNLKLPDDGPQRLCHVR